MLSENIKTLRKQKGYTQETLAQQLNVVRQTVSKWEKGLSVPDAEMLSTMAELFEVPVSVLLGSNIEEPAPEQGAAYEEIAKQLAVLNGQLAAQAARKRKILRRILIGVPVALFLLSALYITCLILYRYHVDQNTVLTRTSIVCELEGETYGFEAVYDQNYRIHEAGGDSFFYDHIMVDRYDDFNVMLAQIEDYVTERGGTVQTGQMEEGEP